MNPAFSYRIICVLVILPIILTGCAQPAAQPVVMKIAVLPILDALPLYVAEAQGYFAKNGVQVELIPVASAPERDQLMQAGQIDGMLNELVATVFYNQDETRIQAIRFLRIATAKYPMFRILAAKGSNIKTAKDLKGVPIGISDGTVIEYTTDRMLEKAGLAKADIQKLSVPKIPDRLSLLASGKLLAASLPDPQASLSIQEGAVVVIDDTSYPEVSHSVLSFSTKSLKANPQAVKSALVAIEQAVKDINGDKKKWMTLLTDKKLAPPTVLAGYDLPDFPTASVPTENQFKDTITWAKDRGFLKKDVNYKDCVDGSYLPK